MISMLIIRKAYFSVMDEETGEEKLYSTNEVVDEETYLEKLYSELDEEEQREFGAKSKVLWWLAPGGYQAKEAAKYGYDEDEYKKKRAGYALKGMFAPGTSTYIKKKVEKMAEEGKSKAEIREYLENRGKHHSTGRVVAGVGEALTGSLAAPVAHGVGLYDKFTGNRAKPSKKEDKKK